jgi:hypothetical protein
VQVRAVAAASGAVAVFLGNEERVCPYPPEGLVEGGWFVDETL